MKNAYLKRFFMVLIDFVISFGSVALSAIIIGESGYRSSKIALMLGSITYPFLCFAFMYVFRVYNIIWKYATVKDFVRIAFSAGISSAALYVVLRAVDYPFTPQLIFNIFFFETLFSVIFHFLMRETVSGTKKGQSEISGNIMVIGGGSAGNLIINDIKNNESKRTCHISCIIDDNVEKHGQYVSGVKVIGGTDRIVTAAKEYNIDIILFAIPTCTSERKAAILNLCQKTDCVVRIIPSVYQLLSDESVGVGSLRDVQIEDLLGRDPINLNLGKDVDYLSGKTVLVTGGGGSIGSELCRQIAKNDPKKLIIFDIYENNAYDIQNELLRTYPKLDLTVLIGSVRDIGRLESLFNTYKPQIVYHAAAHKHVPLMEDSPNESIKNNVFGTLNTVKCADKYGVEKFVLISTDKAVNPTNIMGASKRICEMIVQVFNKRSDTDFVAVRFGNVLGSNGSVIPLFKKQISEGGPVTVTDPNIIRYFMTIPEAVSLVIKAGASAKGGEIFVLDMGEPVKILDLAENLIKLSGYKPYTDIQIVFTGLRPGEKLYEEKLLAEEGLTRTANRLIHVAHPILIDEKLFDKTLDRLSDAMTDDKSDIRKIVKEIVPTYNYRPALDADFEMA